MSISDFDLQKFLDTPIEAFDFQFMIGDVKDFLEFSESNSDWQYRRELQAISNGKDYDDFPSGYRHHLEQNAEHRFKVSLPQSPLRRSSRIYHVHRVGHWLLEQVRRLPRTRP